MWSLWHPEKTEHGLQFRLSYNINWQAAELHVIKNEFVYGSPAKRFLAQTEWVDLEDLKGSDADPSFRVKDREGGNNHFQALFDCLWEQGYRPPSGEDRNKDAIVQAKDSHLDDLRMIIKGHMDIQ